jgi:hypothetical protein
MLEIMKRENLTTFTIKKLCEPCLKKIQLEEAKDNPK